MITISRFIKKSLKNLNIQTIKDPRHPKGKRWRLSTLVNAVIMGMASGLKSLKEVENLTENLSLPARKLLAIKKRIPDTTLRDFLMKLENKSCLTLLYRSIHHMRRQKALIPVGLPFGVVAMDGKTTSLKQAQKEITQKRGEVNVIQTITSTLTSAATKPCINASLIPPKTNESGHFKAAFDELLNVYGTKLFQVVTYDAGVTSLENATWVHAHGKNYLLSLKENQKNLHKLAERHLNNVSSRTQLHTQQEKVSGKIITNTLYSCTSKYLIRNSGWSHLTQVLMVERKVSDQAGSPTIIGNRYFVTNLDQSQLNGRQTYQVIRNHWAVENNCHCVFDKSFSEDDRHWIESPSGNLNILILRRLVYNLLGQFRGRTQRAIWKRNAGWKDLFSRIQINFLQLCDTVYKRILPHNKGSPQSAT
tara:strand:+ start:198 stop:1457 length:1260 start_codon:yes stop_codon:yes gene_type:complete